MEKKKNYIRKDVFGNRIDRPKYYDNKTGVKGIELDKFMHKLVEDHLSDDELEEGEV